MLKLDPYQSPIVTIWLTHIYHNMTLDISNKFAYKYIMNCLFHTCQFQ